jgi:hypothetical protein
VGTNTNVRLKLSDAVALKRSAEGGLCSIAFNRTSPLQGGTVSAEHEKNAVGGEYPRRDLRLSVLHALRRIGALPLQPLDRNIVIRVVELDADKASVELVRGDTGTGRSHERITDNVLRFREGAH